MIDMNFSAGGQQAARRILVVEDDEVMRGLIEHILVKQGFQVFSASEGEEALEHIRGRKPDAIILDAMMPGMDGYEVLHTLRADNITRDIPVLMLSARALERDVISGFDFGANDYLVKPFRPEDLVTRLKRLLNRARGEETGH
jgi:DNA-binding response OmpR family regulator